MKIASNGITLHYLIEGREGAPWVTFSHSLACDLRMWEGQVEALGREFRLLRYDTRGHGRSDAPSGAYSFDMLMDDVVGLWDALGIRRSHFIGLSLGGMTALGLALEHRERLESICVCDARADTSEEAAKVWSERAQSVLKSGMDIVLEPTLQRWFTGPAFAAKLPGIAQARQMILGTPPQGYAGCAEAIRQLDYLPRLGQITTPALFIVGSEDPGAPPEAARAMHEAVKGSRLVEIAGAAHLANLERPTEFNRALLGFLKSEP